MINYEIVKQTLRTWVVSQVPATMPVIFYQPNAPRPVVAGVNVPYVTLYISTTNQLNEDWTNTQTNNLGIVQMKGDRQFILQVQAYGGDPLTLLENLRTSLQKDSVLSALAVGGLAYYTSLGINDITELVDSQFERRAQIDFSFALGQVYTDNPGYFDHLQVREVFLDAENVIVYDEILNIPEL